jgi:hypothetical protein
MVLLTLFGPPHLDPQDVAHAVAHRIARRGRLIIGIRAAVKTDDTGTGRKRIRRLDFGKPLGEIIARHLRGRAAHGDGTSR